MPEAESAAGTGSAPGVEAFEYADSPDAPFVPSWDGWDQAPDAGAERAAIPPGAPGGAHGSRVAKIEADPRLAEEARRSFEAGRVKGVEEGRRMERESRAAAESAASQERARQAARLIESFAAGRDRYFLAVEQEVVKLALAVAARILRREAQADPLLLMGAVRVALGQVPARLETTLRVPAADFTLWTEAIALVPHLKEQPRVVAGEGMQLGDCVLETAMGSADLSVRAQLAEIERVFSDGRAAVAEHSPASGIGEGAA